VPFLDNYFSDDLKGQVVWVTGASSGIGAACALEAAKHGAKLVISARSQDLLQEVKVKCLGISNFYRLNLLRGL